LRTTTKEVTPGHTKCTPGKIPATPTLHS